jgi:hypothetical protein
MILLPLFNVFCKNLNNHLLKTIKNQFILKFKEKFIFKLINLYGNKYNTIHVIKRYA